MPISSSASSTLNKLLSLVLLQLERMLLFTRPERASMLIHHGTWLNNKAAINQTAEE